MKRIKELEEENRRLKKMYAEECLKAEIIQAALEDQKACGKEVSSAGEQETELSRFDRPLAFIIHGFYSDVQQEIPEYLRQTGVELEICAISPLELAGEEWHCGIPIDDGYEQFTRN